MTEVTEPYDQFALSTTLTDRLRLSGSRASVAVQLAASIPQPAAQTQASPSPQMTRDRYRMVPITDGAVAYWILGPYEYPSSPGVDAVVTYGSLFPIYTSTTFYGYLCPIVGTYTPLVGGGAIPSMLTNDAVAFGAADGVTIPYFPFSPYESYFLGKLGFAVGEDFGWEFWVKTTQTPAGAVRLVEQSSGGVFPYRVQLMPSGAIQASRSDGTLTAAVTSAQTVNDGAWHYVAVGKNGSSFGVAIDGNAESTITDTLIGTTTLTVAAAVAGDGYIGAMDELALYPAHLSLAQRQRRLAAAAGTDRPV